MRKITFLIVDDSPVWRRIIRKFVEEKLKGIVVAEASDGLEAINLYNKLKPNVVTMDIEMPKLDGIRAIEEILKYNKDAKVIVISSKGEEDIVRKALLKGARDFIIKDLETEKWLKKFENVMKEDKPQNTLLYNIKRYIDKFKGR
ncbi:response regulator receiver protein [Caldicellulosiruptor owensensis OL]|uniref:Response regulator receiver protein n=1 Tax=Caldicellulosiruptor owensensis (strain ATCC 700167 / DSM 13100 / OL) TaxID=632518 RepID=E4Q3Z7_CALOW|nr:response regulator [Caldicellulosiruptor owensensis]ADQ04032.1 response regulator receiver protein [Caldicellulosiruptor owensensis OL]